MKKRIILITFIISSISICMSQSKTSGDVRTGVVKIESGWNKSDNSESSSNASQPQLTSVDGITFYATSDGVYITLPKATSNVKLFALTGDVVWSGDLVQGKFLIPTRKGIYFLRINNKSYKVICK